ncbi:DUF1168-domain-containing protein [Mytilinidion resinicola]|uniref:DUF1168-domain-containing protein n=1 Tax=Mytilinidion resinicola TaxID=574789 RepID=A0A6A6Y902_9PEZI|nr:DUF1168-domain-containing protein [Mytilinidion resinicola]KAF2805292.1 DUF1168-domain-containing protein [Mytilinidion resinicola]
MSEPIPESIPTSADPRSKRPTKKRALTPLSQQSSHIEALFAKPDREIKIPSAHPKHLNGLAAPPEIVANVQGSSAGAGSGEFHVYKASRRREYERLRLMDEEVKREEAETEFQRQKEEVERRDREKTGKNKARRDKARQRKAKKAKGGVGEGEVEEGQDGKGEKGKRLGPNLAALKARGGEDEKDGDALNEGGEVKNAEEIGIVIHDDD